MDVFALGVILWELINGARLFLRRSKLGTLKAILACELPPTSMLDPRDGSELESIVRDALCKDPAGRFPTALTLGEALESWLHQTGHRIAPAELGLYVEGLLPNEKRLRDTLFTRATSNGSPYR